ncbi:MAG: hypothetical protein FWE49_06225, partial [Synergistaceae bacterium]|nr:hypothetical protein [Synergistaceae bacterium]
MTKKSIIFTALICLIGISLCAGIAHAAPSVRISDKKDRVTIQESVTAEILAQVKKEVAEGGAGVVFVLQKINEADLATICEAFPGMKELEIDGPTTLTSIAPVAKVKGPARFTLKGGTVTDFSPLSDLTTITNLEIRGNNMENGMMAPDLKWMSKLTNLTRLSIGAPSKLGTLVSFEGIPSIPKLTSAAISGGVPADLTPLQALSGLTSLELTNSTIADLTPLTGLPKLGVLSLYGATVRDFSPLAGCPALKELTYYATQGSDYSTLGKVTQIETLKGGLTALDDISWIPALTKLKKFELFSESVKDYTPLAKIQLEDLQIWQMKVPADLTQLSGVVSLKKLKLWNLKSTGFEGLGTLVNLEELILEMMNASRANAADM